MEFAGDLRNVQSVLKQITSSHKPLWGSMTPQHMIEHLIDLLRCSRGEPALPLIVDEQRAAVGRRFLLGDRPLPRNVDNPLIAPDKPLQYPSLAEAVTALTGEIDEFYRFFEAHPSAAYIHPFFGELSFGEWLRFHHKHFRHHCEQFGLVYPQTDEQQ